MKPKALPPMLVFYTSSVRKTPLAVPEPVPVRVTLRAVAAITSLRRWRLSSFLFKRMESKELLAILNADAISVRPDMLTLQSVLSLKAGSAGACWQCQC